MVDALSLRVVDCNLAVCRKVFKDDTACGAVELRTCRSLGFHNVVDAVGISEFETLQLFTQERHLGAAIAEDGFSVAEGGGEVFCEYNRTFNAVGGFHHDGVEVVG